MDARRPCPHCGDVVSQAQFDKHAAECAEHDSGDPKEVCPLCDREVTSLYGHLVNCTENLPEKEAATELETVATPAEDTDPPTSVSTLNSEPHVEIINRTPTHLSLRLYPPRHRVPHNRLVFRIYEAIINPVDRWQLCRAGYSGRVQRAVPVSPPSSPELVRKRRARILRRDRS